MDSATLPDSPAVPTEDGSPLTGLAVMVAEWDLVEVKVSGGDPVRGVAGAEGLAGEDFMALSAIWASPGAEAFKEKTGPITKSRKFENTKPVRYSLSSPS